MTRRQLACRSGVSERYLAQLESGQGNMSIVLLRKVAFALELPLPRLVAEEDAEPIHERPLVGGASGASVDAGPAATTPTTGAASLRSS